MSIYTKRGDRGITDMAHVGNISKSDDRIRLMGEADELNKGNSSVGGGNR